MDAAKLAAIPLFTPLLPSDLEAVAGHLEERTAEAGEVLSLEHATGYFFFVILDGTAEVSHGGTRLARLGPGDFFGETAILEAKRRTATVAATSAMDLAVMFGADFTKLLADHPLIAERIEAAMRERAAKS